MEDNKAFNKAELQILDLLQSNIEGSRYGKVTGIFETVPKLYSLTTDVAVKFAVYCRLEHPLVHGYDNGQLDTIFTNFITHIYQPK